MVKLNMAGAIPTNHFPLAAFMLLDVNCNHFVSLLLSDFNSSSSVPFCYRKGVKEWHLVWFSASVQIG